MKVELKSDGRQSLYLASILMVITIDRERKNIVQKNLHLIQAESDDVAYDKALKLGKDTETSYLNSKDQLVNISFYGLAELALAIEEDIYDGMELAFEEFDDVSPRELENLVSLKKDLDAFSVRNSILEEDKLDYGSKEIRDMAKRIVGKRKS